MTPSMTLEVGETIEPGQSMTLDTSTGRVFRMKMDRRGSIVGNATEKFYKYDVIRLCEGSHSQWEVDRTAEGTAVVTNAKHSPRTQQGILTEIKSLVPKAVADLTQELRSKRATAIGNVKLYEELSKDETLEPHRRAQYAIRARLQVARSEALSKALNGLLE